MAKITKPTLVSVDAGNGFTNAVTIGNAVQFPSVRAATTDLQLGIEYERQFDRYVWGEHLFIVGDDVTSVSKRAIERHSGADRYGDEFHRFLVAVALHKLGLKSGPIRLALFAPPGLFAKAKPMMLSRFYGELAIQLTTEKKATVYDVVEVTVLPEGLAAAFAIALNDRGEYVNAKALTGRRVVLDIGAYTTEALELQDGNFNPAMLDAATRENDGIATHVWLPILNKLKGLHDDFSLLTADDIDVVIRRGASSGDYTLTVGAKSIDIKPLLDKAAERFAETLANNIGSGVFQGFREYAGIILVGGGSTLVAPYFKRFYGEKVVDLSDQPNTCQLHPADLNAVGGLRLMLLQSQNANT